MKPVCGTCADTHRMEVRNRAGDVVKWLCTHCPVPCSSCVKRGKNGGPGAYCNRTPCECDCHKKDLQAVRESLG